MNSGKIPGLKNGGIRLGDEQWKNSRVEERRKIPGLKKES